MNPGNLPAIVLAIAAGALSPPAPAAHLRLAFNPVQVAPDVPEALPACVPDAGLAGGTLGAPAGGPCHVGLLGDGLGVFAHDPDDPEIALTANFTSGAFANGLTLLGPMTLRVHVMYDPVGCGGSVCYPLQASLGFMLEELRADGRAIGLGANSAIVGNSGLLSYLAGDAVSFDVGAQQLAAGSRLRLRLFASELMFAECDPVLSAQCLPPSEPPAPALSSAAARLVYGGAGDFAASGVTFAVSDGVAVPDPDPDTPDLPDEGPGGDLAGAGAPGGGGSGGLGLAPLALLLLAGLSRAQRRAVSPSCARIPA